MPANPERMRPTALSQALIVQEANNIIGKEAFRILEICKEKNLPDQITIVNRFLLNKAGEPKEIQGEQQ